MAVTPNFYHSPRGTKYWIPNVPTPLKPATGMVFGRWEDAVTLYQDYAQRAGFDIRLSTIARYKGVITHRYIVCSRFGNPNSNTGDSMDVTPASSKQRNSSFKVTDCQACIKLKPVKGTEGYSIYKFIEPHNHGLVDVDNMDLTRGRRQLTFTEQEFIHKAQTSGFGATVSHRMQASLKGGEHLVRGTKTDHKNFARDIREFIGERDAQMVIDKLNGNMLHLENFYFNHTVVNGELRSLFWVDDICKCNYNAFGDVVAFDATYDTNKYNMIFVPFTGVDNHQKCVTFGAGLLYNETIESFTWLLDSFLKAHVKHPRIVLTDQDAAMKQAVSSVFTESTHRLCMWHVTKKLPAKVCGDKLENTDLRSRIHKLVWNVFIKPSTFESRWKDLMDEFDLGDNNWLNDMFEIRDQWVPAYFRDLPMCCLMKTTSRCESSNSLFKVYSSSGNTLVQFMLCYENTLNAQRFEHRRLQYETTTTSPKMLTSLPIERHASYIYTHNLFKEVQKEIHKGLYSCGLDRVETVDGCRISFVNHHDKSKGLVGEFKVTFTLNDGTIECSCRGFTRIGYLCRHIFCVFRNMNIDVIPDQYVASRWRHDVLPPKIFSIDVRYSGGRDEKTIKRQEATTLFNECADRVRGDLENLIDFVEDMRMLKEKIYQAIPEKPAYNSKAVVISDLTGYSEPESVTATAPKGIRNKGCGTSRRLIGPGEKAVERSQKPKRLCRTCFTYTTHDSRNCKAKDPKGKKKAKKSSNSKGKGAQDDA
ncbi:putative transcription factor FAR family [Helianthus debilis subsp. tardiflorus]